MNDLQWIHAIDFKSLSSYEVQQSIDRLTENLETLRIVRNSYISNGDKVNLEIINSKIKDCLLIENKLIQQLKKFKVHTL